MAFKHLVTADTKTDLGSASAVLQNALAATTLTIASGAVTPTRASHVIAAESGTSDDLTTVTTTNFKTGDQITIVADSGDTITLKHGTGNITTDIGVDIVLDAVTKYATLYVTASGVVASLGGGARLGVVLPQATGDGSTNDRTALADADTAAAGSKAIYLKAGTYAVASNLTIASRVIFEPGAKLKPGSGVVVTLAKTPEAGRQQIFDYSGSGSFAVSEAGVFFPEWFGVAINSGSDQATAFGRAVDTAQASSAVLDGGNPQAKVKMNTILAKTLASATALHWRNMTLDFSSITPAGGGTQTKVVALTGPALGSPITVSSGASRESNSIAVASATGISAGDWFFLWSDDAVNLQSTPNEKCALVQVAASYSSGTTIPLATSLPTTFSTSPRLVELAETPGSWVNVSIIGPNTETCSGLVMERINGFDISGGNITKCTRDGVLLISCANVSAKFNKIADARLAGLGYAFNVQAGGNLALGAQQVRDCGMVAALSGSTDSSYNYMCGMNVNVSCDVAFGLTRSVWDTHPGFYNWTFSDISAWFGDDATGDADYACNILSPRGSIGWLKVMGGDCRIVFAYQPSGCLLDDAEDLVQCAGVMIGEAAEVNALVVAAHDAQWNETKNQRVHIGSVIGRCSGTINGALMAQTRHAGAIHLHIDFANVVTADAHCVLANIVDASTNTPGRCVITFGAQNLSCLSATSSHCTINALGARYRTVNSANGAFVSIGPGVLTRSGSAGAVVQAIDGDVIAPPSQVAPFVTANGASDSSLSGAGAFARLATATGGGASLSASNTFTGFNSFQLNATTGAMPSSGTSTAGFQARIGGANIGAAGYGVDIKTDANDGAVYIQNHDWSNFATFAPLHLNRAGGDVGIASSGGKIGLFGATPVVKQSVNGAHSGFSAAFIQSEANALKDLVNSIRTALINLGAAS